MRDAIMEVSRRAFCTGATAAALLELPPARLWAQHNAAGYDLVASTDRQRIMTAARNYLALKPATVTSFPSDRSPGGPHDFFSEADYFWPNPADPNGPYINRDGQSNPNNFNGHRKAMIALSLQVPALTAAWLLTRDRRYAEHAASHLRAWFVTPDTRMNTNLEYSQGVHGVTTGRNFGIIDTLHLVEVARAASHIAPAVMSSADQQALRAWFRDYLHWLKTSEKGIAEKKTLNNHAVCWALQAAEFARLIDDQQTRQEVAEQYKTVFMPDQLGKDGSFPKELARTKPYSYSIFNFDVAAMLCQSLRDSSENLYEFKLADGRGICKAGEFLYPYLKDKSSWPYKKDVEHFDSLPVRSPGLLFTGLECNQQQYIALWKTMNPDPSDAEIIRNYPVRQPLLWFPSQQRKKA
ncbi:alginate lyase family protein [Terriglobus albidus]|nr:alginate lyase family protein [Terriglobus albidus]